MFLILKTIKYHITATLIKCCCLGLKLLIPLKSIYKALYTKCLEADGHKRGWGWGNKDRDVGTVNPEKLSIPK